MKKLVNLDQLRQVQTRVKAYALDLVSKLADATTQAVAETQASVTVGYLPAGRLDQKRQYLDPDCGLHRDAGGL